MPATLSVNAGIAGATLPASCASDTAAAVLFVALLGGAEHSRARDDGDRKHPDARPAPIIPRAPSLIDTLGLVAQVVSCSGRGVPNDLRWDADSFEYDGNSFTASIRSDGSVQFHDRDTRTPGSGPGDYLGVVERVMGQARQDPHALERDCVMDQTQKLRQALERAHGN